MDERVQKLLNNPAALLNMVRRIAIEAGDITLRYFYEIDDLGVDTKSDGSPVSFADRDAEAHINQALAALCPGIPVIGEEAAALGMAPQIKNLPYFWLVDPLDGTREFVSGGEDFTINIALVHEGRPILGVVHVPVKGVCYSAHHTGAATRWSADSGKEKPIRVRRPPDEGLTALSSAHHENTASLGRFLENFKINKVVRRGSSLKICMIAEGKADIYPRFGPTCEWDTAAGEVVLRAAGGYLTDLSGRDLSYGGAQQKFLNPEFVAASFSWFELESES